MRRCDRTGSVLLLAAVAFPLLINAAQAQERQALQTHVSAPADAKWISPMPATQQLNLALTLPLHNQEQLHILLQQLEDPTSPNYHKYLTPAQFTEQFGPSVVEYQQVIGFAQSHGLTVTHTSSSRRLLDVTGSVANIEQAFQVTMQVYQHPTEKRTYYAPNVEPTADSGIPMLGVAGLTDRVLRHPASLHPAPAGGARPDATGSGPGSLFLGSDIRAAYYGTGPLAGGGQALALAEGQWNFSDVQAYYKSVGQILNVPIVNEILAGQNPNCIGLPPSCDDGEEVIDMEQILSMAPNASVLIIYEGVSEVDQFDAFATDNIAKVMSYSFGIGDGNAATDEGYFQQFHAQGQNFFVASGDGGDFDGTGGWPGFSQNVTDVGGTDLVTSGPGGAWQSETGWIGSGGGWCDSTIPPPTGPCYQSPYDATPTYQAPVITSTNGGSTLYRNVPDVAAEANTDNFFCGNGSCGGIGGTSLAAPRFAGFVALVNEQAAANGETVGFLNPLVYTLGQGANYSTAFHDITSGNNNGFNAVAGYDLVTGWGTPNGPGLIDALAPTGGTSPYFTLAATPTTLTVTPGGASQTAAISLTAGNSFSGTVNLTASVLGAPPGITANVSPTSITGAATSTLTVAADSSTNSSSFVAGNVEVVVVGTSSGGIQTQPAFVTLGVPSFALSATPSGIYLNQASTATSTIGVTLENGFTGSVTLSSVTGLPSGVTGGFNPTTITSATPSTLTLTATSTAATGLSSGLNVIGASGNISQYTPATSLSVSAATGTGGSGTPINLGSAYNLPGIYADGITFGTGMDGAGYGYSSKLLTPNRVFNGVQFNFGPANTANCNTAPACTNDVVSAAGQVVTLPSGQFTTLQLLATAIDGPLLSQSITVTYSDSTTSTFTQGFSDWCSCSGSTPGPGHQPGESFAVVMPYRDGANGVPDNRIFNLYAYTFVLNSAKTVKSLTLPASSRTGAVIVLAATLSAQSLGTPVSLAYNVAGLFNNGITFPTDGGMDGPSPQDNCSGGKACDDAYSATVLGLPATTPPTLTIKGTTFNFGPVNTTDCAASGTTCINDVISLPSTAMTITPTAGQYSGMTMLGTAVQGSHLGTITVNYTTGPADTINQTFSDWCSFGSNTNETVAAGPLERINSDGTLNTDSSSCNLYAYTYTLDSTRTVSNIQLVNADSPRTAYAYVAAITLTGNTSSTPGFTLSATPTTTPASVNAGSSSTATVTVTPANGYTGSVTLSCSIAPVVTGAGAPTCSFGSTSPVSITSATAVTATVTFTTVASSGNAAFRRIASGNNDGVLVPPSPAMPSGLRPLYASWIVVPGLALVGLAFSSRGPRRKRLLGVSVLWIVSAGLIILPACGGGSGGGGGGGCSTAPTVPTGLASSATTSSGTTLNWTASTVSSGCSVTSYSVYENGNPIATTANTTYNVTGLTAGTQYSFTVAASDSAGASAQSSAINVTTLSNGTPSGTYTITITGKDANGVTQTGSAPTVTAVVN